MPAYMLETVSDISVVQCGDKGHKYSICGEDSTQRKQEADEMDPCECAKRCREDKDCEVIVMHGSDVVGVMTSPVDAHLIAKPLGAQIWTCQPNSTDATLLV